MVPKQTLQRHKKCNETKKIIICADDFGQDSPISLGIYELLNLKRINATSCLTNGKTFQKDAALLQPLSNINIGLHLNLTEGKPLTNAYGLINKEGKFHQLSYLLGRSLLHLLNKKSIYNELKAQLDQFIQTFNRKPDFLDGHQHIHHLPIIREVILKLFDEYELCKSNVYIRSVFPLVQKHTFKSMVIQHTGAISFKRSLEKNNIRHNQSFAGIYNFEPESFQNAFKQSLSAITNNGLIMCHPGYYACDDILSKTREIELNYFKSNQYLQMLKDYQISLDCSVTYP